MKSHIYHIMMSFALSLMILTAYIPYSHASQLERVCERGFIGYSYKPSLAKRCTPFWNKWSDEIKTSFNQK